MSLALQSKLFINNEYVDALSGKTIQTMNPATEELILTVQEAGKSDVDVAVNAAVEAFKTYSTTHGSFRRDCLLKLADLMEKNIDRLAEVESLDNGKPVHIAKYVDVTLCIKGYRYYAGFADKICGKTLPLEGDNFGFTLKEPVGVVGAIIPWNFPLVMQMWKLAPSLTVGCTVVMKLSEKTPLTGLMMGELFKEAGFPPGVVNIINGHVEAGEAIATHPKIDKLSFTGSTAIGKHVAQLAAKSNLKKVTLELGGKSPMVICADADLNQAMEAAHLGLFLNQGQCCCASSRIFVERSIYDKVVDLIVEKAKIQKVGDPRDETTNQGPQVDKIQFDRIMNQIDSGKKDAESGKCRLLLGGNRLGDKGYFIEPTIFADCKDDQLITNEEIFGPVMQLAVFDTYDEVIERCNSTTYGLGAGVITRDIAKGIQLAKKIRTGSVWINCYDNFDICAPFGGYKESGWGRDKGEESLNGFLETKFICWPTNDFK